MIQQRLYGTRDDGIPVVEHVLWRPGSPRVGILDHGATINSLQLDPDDPTSDVAVGFPTLDARQHSQQAFFGAVIGRCANRIAGSGFILDGRAHRVMPNEGEHCLHGGPRGFDTQRWSVASHTDTQMRLTLTSPDGDQGFPGELTAVAIYTLIDGGLRLDLEATTSAPTPCLLTSHLYVNLGHAGTIEDHILTVDASHYVPIDDTSIPLGRRDPVAGTPFDLRTATRIGDVVHAAHPQIRLVEGLDHSFEISGTGCRRHARLEEPVSGRTMELWSDAPALQVYTGNSLDGTSSSSSGDALEQHHAIALEPQQHPDGLHQPWGDGIILRPGEVWRRRIEWHFTQ